MRALMLAGAAAASLALSAPSMAAGAPAPPTVNWSFGGLFGTFDRGALQRGREVYTGVCANCHSLNLLSYRNLLAIGYTEDQAKKIAEEAEFPDGVDDDDEPKTRQGRLTDRFKAPYATEKEAREANNGALPPDLSLITKARAGGANYLHALLGLGYEDEVSPETLKKIFATETEKRMTAYNEALEAYEAAIAKGRKAARPEEPKPVTSIEGLGLSEDLNFNAYFPGHQIAMGAQLSEDAVEYTDGTKATVAQLARDVTTFLVWAAEPELEERKRMGVKIVLFLIVLTGLLYAVKRRVWADLH